MNELELVGITKRFGELVAVGDLSLQPQPGEVFRFVGRRNECSGCAD